MENDKIKFSLIIPTLNEEKFLPRLLVSIKKQSLRPLEVIVADAGSIDNTKNIAVESGAIVVEGGTPGVGRNNGALISKGEILIFIDADTSIDDKQFLKKVVSYFHEKKLDVAECYYKNSTSNTFKGRIILWLTNIRKVLNKIFIRYFHKVLGASGGFLIVKKSVFADLEGFDEQLINYEDTNFLSRAVERRLKFDLVPYSINVSTRRYENKSWFTLFKILLNLSLYKGFKGRQKSLSKKHMEEYEKLKGEMGGD